MCLLCCAGAAFGGAIAVAAALAFTCLAAVDPLAAAPMLCVLESCIADTVDTLAMLRGESSLRAMLITMPEVRCCEESCGLDRFFKAAITLSALPGGSPSSWHVLGSQASLSIA